MEKKLFAADTTTNTTPICNPVISNLCKKNPDDAPALFGQIISGLIALILVAASLWTFIQLLLAGLSWISSGGDKGALESAQKRFTNAIIGLFILFASWAIYLLLMQFLGVSKGPGLNFEIPPIL